jgi:hypothetical protein
MTKLNNEDIHRHFVSLNQSFNELRESIPAPEHEDINTIIQRARISPLEEVPIPPVCLEITDKMQSATIATRGNFSAVIGKAKSKKTFLITMALATSIRNEKIQDKMKASLPDDKSRVVFFDTEQSRYHVHKVVKRVCYLSETMIPNNFDCYCLRSFTPKLRIEVIEHILSTTDGIGLVVIDGVRDLVKDINNPEEATDIVGNLMRWSEEKDIHIIVVLHQNKGDNNARGHLGTEVINKAETVISVTRDSQDSSISIVEAEYCRDKDFPPFAFRIDDKGLPYVLNDWQPPKEGKRTQSPFDYPKETHIKILTDVFQRNPKPQYSEFWQEVKYSFQQYGLPGGDNKAKEWVKYYENQDMVTKVRDGKYNSYQFRVV